MILCSLLRNRPKKMSGMHGCDTFIPYLCHLLNSQRRSERGGAHQLGCQQLHLQQQQSSNKHAVLVLCLLQVPGSMLKQMPPPSGSVGGVGGVGGVAGLGGGVFPPQLSPQQIAMLSSIYPPPLQFQLVGKNSLFLCFFHRVR